MPTVDEYLDIDDILNNYDLYKYLTMNKKKNTIVCYKLN